MTAPTTTTLTEPARNDIDVIATHLTDRVPTLTGRIRPDRDADTARTAAAESVASISGRVAGETIPARNAVRIDAVAGTWAGAAGLTLDTLPGRDLSQSELLQLTASVAADAAPLEQHIALSDDRRHYVSLHRDTHVDVWLLCWTPQNDTGWHDHDISSGAVAGSVAL